MKQRISFFAPFVGTAILFATLFAVLALFPAQAAQPGPLAGPTPVAAVNRTNAPEYPTFFSADVLTADTRSDCFELPDYGVVDLHFVVDQTFVALAPNTTTLKLQFSNDGVNFVDGIAVSTNNITDTNDMQQVQLFGRFACVYADVTNTNPVTFTVLGVAK